MDYKIISVESRKGGVGKTTAALNLATVLLEKNYAVLFLDVDITGTSIMGAFRSSYWKDKVNPIKEDGKDVNLLRLFQEKFLIGDDVPLFSKNNDWLIDASRINILQSEIYQSNSDGKFECDPRILFDELHSFWLTNMLKSICANFISIVKNDNSLNKKVVIILDNSPGYVGLAKSIHEWLFEIGPDKGKFLSISSLDNQDLRSTLQAIESINITIEKKRNAIDVFKQIKDSKSDINTIPNEIKDLIVKFATSEDVKLFKCSPNTTLKNYQALIVNKVPSVISNKTLLYDFSELKFEKNKVSELLYSQSTLKIRNSVKYDNNINFQFVEAFLTKKTTKRPSKSWHFLKERISNIIEKSIDIEKTNDLLILIETYEQRIQSIYRLLQSSELKYLSEIIDEKWFPKSPFQELSDNFENLISDYPFYPMKRMYRDKIRREENEYRNIQIEKFIHNHFNKMDLNESYIAIELIKYLLSNTLTSYDIHTDEFDKTIGYYFDIIIELQKYRFKEQSNKKTFKQFLATEDIGDINESNDLFHQIRERVENNRLPMLFENISFGDFYNSFCHAQSRLIDFFDDYQFLLYTFQYMISEDSKNNRIVFPNIHDTLSQVIIEKSIPHTQAKEKLAKSIYEAKYMVDFKKEVQCICVEWGLIK